MSSDHIFVNNLRFNFYVIIYTSNCVIDIESNGYTIKCERNNFLLFERNVILSARIIKINSDKAPYIYLKIDRDTLKKLQSIFFGVYGTLLTDESKAREVTDKIISLSGSRELVELFEKVSICSDMYLKLTKLALFLSKLGMREKIIESIYISSVSYFSDKVRTLIETDLAIRWKLSMVADEFNVSEITIRKRLESEKTTFNQLITYSRMNKAAVLILENKHQISQISSMIGISNPSYFIKTFKEHFCVTPKQFFNYFKR